MDTKLVREIRRTLDAKSTDELIQIYRHHNEEKWSSEAFEAIQQILIARSEAIPTIDHTATMDHTASTDEEMSPVPFTSHEDQGMDNRMWLFSLLLGVPLFGFTVAESLYTTHQNLNLLRTGAFWTGIVGLALILVIRLAGTVARTNRWLLLSLFAPGLYLTVLILVVLILGHAAVAMATLYYVESILVGRVHVFVIGAIGLGALIGILNMVSNAFALVQKARTYVLGKMVSREQASALWQHVEDIAERLGALHPQHIVVGLDPNFFVTEADVVCLDGTLSGRTLYCSLPLCRILSTKEFSAIIGHELGHYKGLDTQFSQRFFPIYRGTVSSIVALQQSSHEGARVIALLPALAVLSYFLECFSVAESRISRSRELVADQEGVTVSDRDSATSALVKVHAFSGYWNVLETATARSLQLGEAVTNSSKTFADVVASGAKPEALQDIGATHLAHPTDTHPPLSIRLEALGMTLEEVSEAALNVQPTSAAIQL